MFKTIEFETFKMKLPTLLVSMGISIAIILTIVITLNLAGIVADLFGIPFSASFKFYAWMFYVMVAVIYLFISKVKKIEFVTRFKG